MVQLPLDQLQKPHLIRNGRKIECTTSNHVRFVVLGLSTSSSPTSPTSSSQEAGIPTEHPASARSESTSDELRGDSEQGPAEFENPNKNDDDEVVRGHPLLSKLHGWLQDFRENLVDDSVPEHRDASSSSHELHTEPRAEVEPGSGGKHSVFTHFPKDRNCDICFKTIITRASYRRCSGIVVPRAEILGDLITADRKVLCEGCASRYNHRCAVVAQDLATQWIQSHPCKTKTSQEAEKSLHKFLEPTRKPKVIYTDTPWNLAQPVKIFPGIIVRQHRTDRKRMGLLREQCAELRKGHLRVLLQSGLEKWWADSMECYCFCEFFRMNFLMRKHLTKGGSECLLTGPRISPYFW